MPDPEGRLEREGLLRGLFEQCPVGLAILGLDGRILNPNHAFCAMLGYGDRDLPGRALLGLTHPEDVEAGGQLISQLCRGEIGGVNIDRRYLRKDGTWLWGNLTAALIRDSRGERSMPSLSWWRSPCARAWRRS